MKVKDLVFITQHNDFIKCSLHIASSAVGEFKVFEPYLERILTTKEVTRTSLFDNDGKFWLVSGNFDIRKYPETTVEDAVDLIKYWANTCIGE